MFRKKQSSSLVGETTNSPMHSEYVKHMRTLTCILTINSGLGRLLKACQVHEKVALEHSSKSAKHELEGSYNDQFHEFVSSSFIVLFFETAEMSECSSGLKK